MEIKTGCSVGRTILIDPNEFDGQNSSSNISVPLEDLSIYVQLETTKKARTVLTTNGDRNVPVSSGGAKVTFIEGSIINGKKVLTTNYTDLTTDLNSDNQSEGLGITSIDIDFNSSYAPVIVINFIDIRGTAIHQNEKNILNNVNKYSSFFQLPYPLFVLTIKGFYGMPVKYELHMTKYNSKFNSQTGNFEITANFIGYTYAMLSDMLLGYLKAIPYTNLGAAKYDELKKQRPNLLTLNELMVGISKIDEATDKLKESDPGVADLSKINSKLEILTNLSLNIVKLGQTISVYNELTEYKFLIPNTSVTLVGPVNYDADIQNINPYNTNTQAITNIDLPSKEYNESVIKLVGEFNTDPFANITISEDDFKISGMDLYLDLTMRLLNPNPDSDAGYEAEKEGNLRTIFGSSFNFEEIRNLIFNYGKSNSVPSDKVFNIYDLRNQYKKIEEIRLALGKTLEETKIKVAETLRLKVRDIIGVDPTIRNIVGIFTASVEVFMNVLFDVSKIASTDVNRKKELARKFTNNPNAFDINVSSLNLLPDASESGSLIPNYYQWPEYREDNQKTGLVEKYLGDPYVLNEPELVTEINFINELLSAFITSKQKENEIAIVEKFNETNWVPINPLDTRIFIETFPYKRINGNGKNDIINLLIERAFIYLGYSNYKLSQEEIIKIATSESEMILNEISNDVILQILTQLKPEDFYSSKATNNGIEVPMMKFTFPNLETERKLNFIVQNPNVTDVSGDTFNKIIMPISVKSDGKFVFDFKENQPTKVRAEEGEVFLTNYTTTSKPDAVQQVTIPKPDDGGVYVKILDVNTYKSSVKEIPNTTTNNILDLNVLEKDQESFNNNPNPIAVGFDPLSGSYGIQEFKKLNFGLTGLENAEYRIMFYQDSNYSSNRLVKSSTFCKNRGKDKETPYDIGPKKYKIITGSLFDSSLDNGISYVSGEDKTHEFMGSNRLLLSEYIENKSQDVTFPFITFQVAADTDDANFGGSDDSAPVGLFGSRLYNEQTGNITSNISSDYSKALLFLHTLPWNGFFQNTKGDNPNGIFNTNEILNSFGSRAGFISAPRLWCAFIGGMLWRNNPSKPKFYNGTSIIESGGSGAIDPIQWSNSIQSFIPTYSSDAPVPKRNEYFTAKVDTDFQRASMLFPGNNWYEFNGGYMKIDNLLIQLPEQVKNEFKKVFFDFVMKEDGTSDWNNLKSKLEVYNGAPNNWVGTWNQIFTNYTAGGGRLADDYLDTAFVKSKYSKTSNGKLVFDDYIIFSPYTDNRFKYNYVTELKDNSDGVNLLLKLLSEEVYIANTTYKIWQRGKNLAAGNTKLREDISVKSEDLKVFIDTVISKLKPTEGNSSTDKKKQAENEIFGTDNENIIKFQLYRTCKNIYDKWIGGSSSFDNLIFGSGEYRNSIDKELAIKAGRFKIENDVKVANLALIDSFRFVTRSFRDIGDELFVNPTVVSDFLRNDTNSSFYSVVTSLLSSNNFDFIPLPTYINYGDPEILKKMFQPVSTIDSFGAGVAGPSFVCVYVGETSKQLSFNGSEYPDDGVQFRCDENGNLIQTKAKDFNLESEPYENKVAVFAVNYSQQNQNIFKDITLDQAEFAETAESLQITDDIANRGSENRKTYGGQNMYNVYSVRSYKAQVEMMGNAMVQPMMYFQLNNIPMFHGAYLITHVKHSIKPNYMSTVFDGVRIRNVETPILNASELYMSLLDSVGIGTTTTNTTTNTTNNTTNKSGSRSQYFGFVTYDVPESDSLKFQERDGSIKAKGDSWAMPECGEFMVELAKKWHNANLKLPGTDTLYINNFGAYLGGTNKNHGGDGGLHSAGLACDLQPMAKTKPQQRCIVGEANYDQAKNIEFIQMAIDMSNSQDKIKVQNIILNDSVIINYFQNVKNSQGGKTVIFVDGHHNHIHFEFDYPPRVLADLKNNIKSDELIVTSGVKGSVVKNTGKFPTENEKITALGQI